MTIIIPPQAPACLWCGGPLPTGRRHGSERRFCCAAHRHAFGTAARRWVTNAIEWGELTVEGLKALE